MRIVAIRGQNLASLAGGFAVELDQDPLAHAGLFAITGPTGAGKSTLLDALCVALFDRTPRLDARSSVVIGRAGDDESLRLSATDVRTLLRHGTGAGFAEVEFVGRDGHHYQARWSVRRARNRPDGRLQAQTLELRDLDAGRALGGTKGETLAAIEDRLGFSFEQFRRSALLAQGEFAAFLSASAGERADLLERMTGTEVYGLVSQAAYRRAQDEIRALAALDQDLARWAVLDDEARAAAEVARAGAERDAEAIRQRLRVAEAAAGFWRTADELAEGEQRALAELAEIEAEWNDGAGWRAQLDAAQAAQPLRAPLEAVDRAAGELGAALALLDEAQEAAGAAGEREQGLQLAAKTAADAWAEARIAYEQARPVIDDATRLDAEIAAAERVAQDAARAAVAARSRAETAARERDEIDAKAQQAERVLAEARAWLAAHGELAGLAAEWPRWQAVLARHGEAAADAAARRDRHGMLQAAAGEAGERAVAARRERERSYEQMEVTRLAAEAAERIAADRPAIGWRRKRDVAEAERERLRGLAGIAGDAAGAAARGAAATEEQIWATAAAAEAERAARAAADDGGGLAVALAEAERGLDQMRLALSLADHRASLVDGEHCPLCGASEHPWAGERSPVDVLLDGQRDRVAELRSARAAAEGRRAAQVAAAEAGQRAAADAGERAVTAAAALAAARSRWQEELRALGELPLHADPAEAAAAQWVAARLAAADEHIGALRAAETEAEGRQAKAVDARGIAEARRTDHELAVDAARAAGEAAAAANRALFESLQATARAQDTMARCELELEGAFPSPRTGEGREGGAPSDWRQSLAADPSAFSTAAAATVADYHRREGNEITCRDQLARLSAGRDSARALFEERIQTSAKAQHEERIRAAALQRLRESRAQLLGGRPVADVNGELIAAEAFHHRARDRAYEAAGTAARTAVAARTRRENAQTAVVAREKQLATARAALAGALARAGIGEDDARARLSVDPDWIAIHTELRERLHVAAAASRVVLGERRRRRAEHAAGEPPALDREAAAGALAHGEAEEQAARARVEETTLVLRRDDHARGHRSSIAAAIAEQRDRAALARTLSDLIGSADGKRFRAFAQSLTLEALLGHANQQLVELHDRYRLVRVPGSDLDLQVVDRHMGDEVRGVNSLSGGESFLVSLALALGLSSLAARETRVESLLIDEGFGSLDPATLETALSVLDTLQASGRKVGVISHVPGLAERIGVRVLVEPVGAGRSQVSIQGS